MELKEIIGNTDIYLIDQILKNRYRENDRILDAGCGIGRNLFWFVEKKFDVFGVDSDGESIEIAQLTYPKHNHNFGIATIDNLPFENNFFDHIICSAVLHFAESVEHFRKMIAEMVRVLKPKGSIFIRMGSTIGDSSKYKYLKDGIYQLSEEINWFLLTPDLLDSILVEHNLAFLEPIKTTNVANVRYMTTLVLEKIK